MVSLGDGWRLSGVTVRYWWRVEWSHCEGCVEG